MLSSTLLDGIGFRIVLYYASFLDSKCKNSERESVDRRRESRKRVKYLLDKIIERNYVVQNESSVVNNSGALEFLYGVDIDRHTAGSTVQLQNYLVEPKQIIIISRLSVIGLLIYVLHFVFFAYAYNAAYLSVYSSYTLLFVTYCCYLLFFLIIYIYVFTH